MPKTPKKPSNARSSAAKGPAKKPTARYKPVAEAIMRETIQILQSRKPREKKIELLSVQSALIKSHIKSGLIPWQTGRRLLRALQQKTELSLKTETLSLAYAGVYTPKLFLELEGLVKNKVLSRAGAARLSAEYLQKLFSSKKISHDLVVLEKPIEWKLKFIEFNQAALENTAKRFGFTQAMKDNIKRKLMQVTEKVLDYEARKTMPVVNTQIFGAIEYARKSGLITEEQKNALRQTAIRSQLRDMLAGRTKTVNYVYLESEINQLPVDMRADLIELLKELRARF
ncbi:MAG: hypothetical protein QW400_03620 [Candidatus Diapherotrites archaeon]